MFIAGFPAGPWGTNCYVVATGPGAECVVIDPGKDAAEGVAQVVREHRLKPVSVLVTHGHVDHMWCVAPVAGTYDATAWIHPADRHLLSDPMAGMSRETTQMLLGGSYTWAEPDDVRELSDLAELELAGLRFVVDHTPGHTEGSVTFRTPYEDQADISEVLFSGDMPAIGSARRWRSAGWTQAVASYAPATGATHHTWSTWPCVTRTLTGLSRCSATTRATPSVASMPGSMTTHSEPGAVATT